jgi:hypothetical protein
MGREDGRRAIRLTAQMRSNNASWLNVLKPAFVATSATLSSKPVSSIAGCKAISISIAADLDMIYILPW